MTGVSSGEGVPGGAWPGGIRGVTGPPPTVGSRAATPCGWRELSCTSTLSVSALFPPRRRIEEALITARKAEKGAVCTQQ